MLIFGFVYVYFAIPEVKGLSLEEVDELYRAGVKPWNSAGWRPADWHERARRQGMITDMNHTPEKSGIEAEVREDKEKQ